MKDERNSAEMKNKQKGKESWKKEQLSFHYLLLTN